MGYSVIHLQLEVPLTVKPETHADHLGRKAQEILPNAQPNAIRHEALCSPKPNCGDPSRYHRKKKHSWLEWHRLKTDPADPQANSHQLLHDPAVIAFYDSIRINRTKQQYQTVCAVSVQVVTVKLLGTQKAQSFI